MVIVPLIGLVAEIWLMRRHIAAGHPWGEDVLFLFLYASMAFAIWTRRLR